MLRVRRFCMAIAAACCLCFGLSLAKSAEREADAYEQYVRTSQDFKPVKQDKDWCLQAFPSWTIMPWTYQWTIGYTPASGKWSLDHGYNGAFVDRGNVQADSLPTGRLDWINDFQLRFYMDHTAGKGQLHLWDGGQEKPHMGQLHGNGLRVVPVNARLAETLHRVMRTNIEAVKSSPCAEPMPWTMKCPGDTSFIRRCGA